MFESDGAEGFLLEWSEQRRVQHLTLLARKQTELGHNQRALKMINLAQSWVDDEPDDQISLRFLEGRNLYELGRRATGIAHMRQAIGAEDAQDCLLPNDFLFFAEALFGYGGFSVEKEACNNVSLAIQQGSTPSVRLWSTYVDCSIKRNDLKPLAVIVSTLTDVELLCEAIDRLEKLLIGTVGYTHADAWVMALNRILSSSQVGKERKAYYRELVAQNRALKDRVN